MLKPDRSSRRRTDSARRGHGRQAGLAAVMCAVVMPAVVLLPGQRANARLPRRLPGPLSAAATSRGCCWASSARSSNRPRRSAGPSVPADPLTSLAMRRYLSTRAGDVSVAIEDLDEPVETSSRSDAKSRSEALSRSDESADYREWLLHPNARDETASIIKVDILETLLHQSRGALSYSARVTAEGMIDDSDNDDATDLWNADGGGNGVAAYNRVAGLTQTSPNIPGYWGLTLTSAADQIKLLTKLAYPSRVLTEGSRRYAVSLMEHITPDQDWGVSGGIPRNATVALKNGWLPTGEYGSWEINSIGWVRGDRRDYLIAVLTANDPGEEYGIDTIEHISSLVFAGLRPCGVERHAGW
jgi:hypothetical protein